VTKRPQFTVGWANARASVRHTDRRRYGTPPTAGGLRPRARDRSGANDFDGDTAERYGYVNRALLDAELDGFVDALARRIVSFDRRPLATAKNLINQVSLPSADRLLDALNAFQTAVTWPETQQRIQALLERGLQREGDFENRWPALLGTLLET
jgi:enoyl-CoA hydratase/carnithine racemase